jgi:predicted dehydrogenase
MTTPINVGILGYAHFMRTNFVKHLRQCPSANILGVYNRGEERRKQAEEDGFFATSDLDELLALPGLEAVVVGTANEAHKDHAIASARAGKHIFCEKPMALTLADVDAMTAEAEKAGVITHVNHGAPYGESFQVFSRLCRERAGDVLHFWKRHSRAFGLWVQGAHHSAVANPEASGGWTFHHLCHQLNLACLLIDSPAVRVYHLAQKSCPEAPSEEIVNCLITFASGATAALSDGTPIGNCDDMGVQGTRADLRLLNGTITLDRPGEIDPTGRPGQRKHVIEKYPVKDQGKNLPEVFSLFAKAVRGGRNELLSFRFMRDQYRILAALKRSAETGRAVDLD